jgi:hypothetical protein
LINPLPKPLKCLGFWRTFFKPDGSFSMAFTFQGRPSVSWRWRMFRATTHQQNDRKCWKNLKLIGEDHYRTIHELTDTVGLSYGVCQEILTERLNMLRITTKFVPQLLKNDQKLLHINVCLELQEKANKAQLLIVSQGS